MCARSRALMYRKRGTFVDSTYMRANARTLINGRDGLTSYT